MKKNIQNFYKRIIYFIFKIFHGKIKGVVSLDKNDIKEINFENKHKYLLYFCKNSRIYTDTIHNTAVIKDNYIVNGPSLQFIDNIIVTCEKNSVMQKGTPRFKKNLNGKVFSLLTGGGGNSNYFHWLFDVLPRIIILRKKINLEDVDYFLFPDTKLKFQKESLDLLEIPEKKRISSKNFRHIYADEIISTDHPCVILNDPLKDNENIPIWIIEFYKNEIKSKIKINKSPKKIYIDRGDSKSNIKNLRTITNEMEVKKYLSSKGFEIIKLSDLSFSNQIDLFHNANTVVGLHGAGLSNILFCQPKTKIIELKPSHVGPMYQKLGEKLNLNYLNFTSDSQNIKLNRPNQLGDINVDLTELEKKLIN
tara:strand:- start:8192 stop:9283 length:1092 start_codon:yes stop_codon:yes gene_type:complete